MPPASDTADVVLVGGGVMSATLGLILKQLEPSWKIHLYERLGAVGEESSNGWNNAGTGHSALCELNYTPETNGNINIDKALLINEQFQVSRQWWSHLVKEGLLPNPRTWINTTPHMTFVHGDKNCDFLKRRWEKMQKEHLFTDMKYTDDSEPGGRETMSKWAPLLFDGRDKSEKVAMTMSAYGTDCDFGAVTKGLVRAFQEQGGAVFLYHTVTGAKREGDGWRLTVSKSDMGHGSSDISAKFVFCGCGGWALPVMQKSGIPEAKGFGGFPISGQFLVCQKPNIVQRHPAKIYGKAAVGAPPMSVPHLDARIIDGKAMILFGPYAGFSPKFLKTGSYCDLICSIRYHNLIPMAAAGLQNLDLTVYLIKELLASKSKRMASLQEFMPTAKSEDWLMTTAGQRVQIMKKDPKKWGILQFGTEVVAAKDGTIAGLFGASPGASVAVSVMLQVLEACYPSKKEAWAPKIKAMIPSHGTKLNENPTLATQIMTSTSQTLGIKPVTF